MDDLVEYCDNNGKVMKIYGIPGIREYYPNHYVGQVPYLDQTKLFNRSKINIVTHPKCTPDLPIGEIEFKIMASGGLLVMDKITDSLNIFRGGENCVILGNKKFKYINQIKKILNNYPEYVKIRAKARKTSRFYSWKQYVKNVHIAITKRFFSEKFYLKLYNLDKQGVKLEDAWKYWCKEGIKRWHITYPFDIPSAFNGQGYADYIGEKYDDDTEHRIYMHWLNKSKDKMFLGKKKSGGGVSLDDYKKYNGSAEDVFDTCSILSQVFDYHTREDGLKSLNQKAINAPRLRVDEILNLYMDNVL
jgi:hypothetical protein